MTTTTTIGRKGQKHGFPMGLVLALLLGAPWAPAADLTTGLAGKWSFEGNLVDDTGSNATGTLVNGVGFTNGFLGSGLFPTTNGASPRYANLGRGPGITNQTNQFTLGAWVYYTATNGTSGGRSTIMARMSPNIWLLDIVEPARSLRFILYTNGGSVTVGNTGSIPTNTWIHVGVTYNGSHIVFYTNGLPWTSNAATGNAIGSTIGDLSVGARIDTLASYSFNGGAIDDVRLYGRALTPSDMAAWAATTSCAITNVSAGMMVTNNTVFRGYCSSPVGISTACLVVSNAGGGEALTAALPMDSPTSWSRVVSLPLGDYVAVVLATNSNGVGGVSAPVAFTVTSFSTLTIRTLDGNGAPMVGGRIFGPGTNAYAGLRTNDLAGEVSFANIQVGQTVALTNLSPLNVGGGAVVTNLVMPAVDTVVVWALNTPGSTSSPSSTAPTSSAAYLTAGTGNVALSVDLKGLGHPRVTVAFVRLADGLRKIVYDGVQYNARGNGVNLSLDRADLKPFLSPGLWVVETRLRATTMDEASSVVSRRLLFYAP